ncbi:MAG: HDOD domain-containing protein [Rhodocyclaceae bacterium]|nr:HDOD domain-containing protein [Rhodocyclaceae bacterium]
MATLTIEVQRKLGTAVERMPAFPQSVQKILELTRDINCLPKDLVNVIEKDPVMTMKILKVINSAYYSLPAKITSVNQSVVYLGLNTIKNLALSIAAVGMLPRFNTSGFDIQRYLLHSLTTATLARQVAGIYVRGQVDPGDAYIAGLLHDFGKAVFAQFMASEFRQALAASQDNHIPLHQAELEVIGADHALVGSMLATKWQFPEHLVACIRDHHDPAAAPTPLMDCVRVADQVCRKLAFGDAGNAWREDEEIAAAERFGSFDAVIAALGDLEKVVADAQMFAQV